MAHVKAIVFDLDGTLIASNHDYDEMARRVKLILEEAGVPTNALSQQGRIWEIIQGGVRSLQELGLPSTRIKDILDSIDEALNEVEVSSVGSVELKPGATELLKHLRERGIKIGIATRSCGEYARRSMEASRLVEYFDAVLARDEVEFPKPDPRHLLQIVEELEASPQSAIFVGDTETDQRTARAAGIPFIGVPSSENWRKRMEGKEGSVLVSSLSEIMEMV
ncbi:HAD family hydrolase [Candidatus Bathyarchaeota archaeon]|nr:MAG: HAD family hydrolase [Candidatus Bathyarchaeota archaeon]